MNNEVQSTQSLSPNTSQINPLPLPPLLQAIVDDDISQVFDLILNNTDLNIVDHNGHGFYYYVLNSSNPILFQLLIIRKFIKPTTLSTQCQNDHGNPLTPFAYCIINGNIILLEALLQLDVININPTPTTLPTQRLKNPDLYIRNGYSPYHLVLLAPIHLRIQIMDILFKYGFDPNYQKYRDFYPLLQACEIGTINDVKYLMKLKADPYPKGEKDSTLLIQAAKQGNIELIDYILTLNNNYKPKTTASYRPQRPFFDLFRIDETNHNAITTAIINNQYNLVVHLFTKYKIPIGYIGHNKRSFLHYAAMNQHQDETSQQILDFIYNQFPPQSKPNELLTTKHLAPIHEALATGNENTINFLLSKKASLQPISHYHNILHLAAVTIHSQAGIDLFFKLFPQTADDINAQNAAGWNGFLLAAINVNIPMVTKMASFPGIDFYVDLPMGVNLGSQYKYYIVDEPSTIFEIMLYFKHIDIIRILLESGMNPLRVHSTGSIFRLTVYSESLPMLQLMYNYYSKLEDKSDPKWLFDRGGSAMTAAVLDKAYYAIEFFLEHNMYDLVAEANKDPEHATIEDCIKNTNSPLHLAALNGHIEAFRIISKYYPLTQFKKHPLMIMAMPRLHFDAVKYLATECPELIETPGFGYGITPLLGAVKKRHVEMIQYLYETCGASLTALDKGGRNIFHLLSMKCGGVEIPGCDPLYAMEIAIDRDLEVLKYVTQHVNQQDVDINEIDIFDYIDINKMDHDGKCPIHYAVESNKIRLVSELYTSYGANVKIRTRDEKYSIIELCQTTDMLVTLLHLINWCTGTSVVNINEIHPITGNTPLHHFAQRGKHQFVNMLIKYGAKVNIRNKDGKLYSELFPSKQKTSK